jgi:exosortase H (IPTLxxWG-CTERM-specific)
MLRFLGIFLALVSGFYALTLSPWADAHLLMPVMKASARGTSALLNLAGCKTTSEGVTVFGPGYSVAVRRGCDPLEPIVLFSAAVIAFPASWRKKLAGVAVGAAFLFGLNLLRLVSLYLLGAHKSSLFENFHLWLWPAFFILCSLALWVSWLLWIQPPALAPKANPRPTQRPRRA